ncbi:carbohydrate ABC transporter substrate-binding protein [Natronospirillum operosum]|uniref:Carbohydrate ABC transporter substrate-binding protein n=1 Tax=Natronospirillum operosum TaxID=2759953 RepID=A0A4Z0WE18_9GAMM|nr:ABC transporter substrate-binding protein [Natronospirillum operosum]TGG93482.1 carbohydrate ABC transporter substrate-binding protein [Natronospirillum operosum]
MKKPLWTLGSCAMMLALPHTAMAQQATELTFWTFQQAHATFFEDAEAQWNEANPDRPIDLNAEVYPYDQVHSNLLLALQSGRGAPDLADIEVRQISNYLQGDVPLVPLNDVVEPVLDEMVTSRFDIYAKDGNYYGVDYHVGASVMYYNQEIMDAAGVNIDDIETWEDYAAAGEQVTANTDAVMTTFESDDIFSFWIMIAQQGSDIFDADGQVSLDNQTNIDTLQFMQDMIHEHGTARAAPGGGHHSEEYFGFMNNGGAASVMMPMWYMGRFIDNMPDLENKMQVRPLPRWTEGGDRSAGMGGTGTVITRQSADTELAKEFLAFAKLTRDANIRLWTVLGFDPIRHEVWDSEEVQADNAYYQFFHEGIFNILLDIRDEIPGVNIHELTPTAQQVIETNTLHTALRTGNRTAEQALTQAADEIRMRMR